MVAVNYGLETGGHIPRGFRTVFGPAPELADYGLIETASNTYPPRTKRNVVNSDATVRLASNFMTAGERLTLRYAQEAKKPVHDVILDGLERFYETRGKELAMFIMNNDVRILNVAGNADRDKIFGQHFYRARRVLMAAFDHLKAEGFLEVK